MLLVSGDHQRIREAGFTYRAWGQILYCRCQDVRAILSLRIDEWRENED